MKLVIIILVPIDVLHVNHTCVILFSLQRGISIICNRIFYLSNAGLRCEYVWRALRMNLSYMLTAFACYSRVAPTFSLNGIKKHITGQSEAVVADWRNRSGIKNK